MLVEVVYLVFIFLNNYIMPTIYLVDYLGVHCGMHYYLEAFKRVLLSLQNYEVKILSNYSDNNESPFFLNQYQGNKLKKGVSLVLNLRRIKDFIRHNPDDVYIYLTYGNRVDYLFLKRIAHAQNHIVDIHEAIAQNVDYNLSLKQKFKALYSKRIKTVISHSTRTDNFLKEYNYDSTCLCVPHFKYIFPKNYDYDALSSEIKDAVDNKKINLLFFGNLNESKGIDILLEAVNKLDDCFADRLNVIIAGKDFDGAVYRVPPKQGRNITLFPRHISDDELRFLYSNVDYLALPYRKTSQSGILEMAFYFKRPIIASDVPYFRKMLHEFPSFGILSGSNAIDYANTLMQVILNHDKEHFYKDCDYARYENRAEISRFLNEFSSWMVRKI